MMTIRQREAFDQAVERKSVTDRAQTQNQFKIHERKLSTLLLELQHRKIEVSAMDRDNAIEKIITVYLSAPITQRKANAIIKTIRVADEKSERFLNLTSPTYKTRP